AMALRRTLSVPRRRTLRDCTIIGPIVRRSSGGRNGQRDGLTAMVAETGCRRRIRRGEVSGQTHAVEERAAWVPSQPRRQSENVFEPLTRTGGHYEDAET